MLLAPDGAAAHPPGLVTRPTAEATRTLEDVCRTVSAALVREWTARCRRLVTVPAAAPPADAGLDPTDRAWLARLIDLAGEVSATGPAAVVGRVADALNFAGKPVNGSRLFVLGVGDPASGPGLAVLELLIQKGARVEYHDPAVPTLPAFRNYPRLRLVSRAVTAEAVAACDAVVVLAGPAADAGALAYKFAPLVIDARVAIASAA